MTRPTDAVREALSVLFEDGDVVELRALDVPEDWTDATFTHSGYFNDLDALAAAAVNLDRNGAKGIYVTINPVEPDLLARARNRVQRSPRSTTKNEEITRRRWLPLDFDPERPAGISSTDAEVEAARDRAIEAARFLADRGFPGGMLAISGNGAHLLYRIDLPVNDDGLIKRVLEAVAERFDGDGVEVDTGVHNAARIWKLYGTTARKGDPTEERPHRRARILRTADPLRVVPTGQLEALAEEAEQSAEASSSPTSHRQARGTCRADDNLSEEEVRKALSFIPSRPGYNDGWFQITAAVYDAVGGDVNLAEQLLREWSREEKEGEYRRILESDLDGSITAGTLIHEAQQHGYEHQRNGRGGTEGNASGKKKKQDAAQAERLLRMVGDVDLFHSPDGTAYATFEQGGATQTAEISSSIFADLLRQRFFEAEGRPPASQALQDAKDVLRARARFDGPERKVHLRVAGRDGRIYIDLCNDAWEIVEITPDDWRVIKADEAPVRFRRAPGMKELPRPERGGTLDLLRRHVPVRDDDAFALLLGFLVQALRPDGPYPLLELTGEQGSGKTTVARIIGALIDPSHVPVRTRPREERDLVIYAENSWLLVNDNLSGVPAWLSDAYCRLSTGGGFSTRRLYSNRGEELFYSLRPIILNGIDDITTRGDLADRAITLRLTAIPEDERRTETDVWGAFEKDRPSMLGALFDVLSTALRRIGDVTLDRLPRMADFAKWAVAAEPALPIGEGAFMDAYAGNRRSAREDAVANDTVASAIVDLLEDEDEWTGKTSTLLEDLKRYLPDPERPPRDYPSTYQAMGHHLRRIMPALRGVGIGREDDPRERSRTFTLRQITPATKAHEADEANGTAPHDAESGSERALFENGSGRKRTEADAKNPSQRSETEVRTQRALRALHLPPQSTNPEEGHESESEDSTSQIDDKRKAINAAYEAHASVEEGDRVETPKFKGEVREVSAGRVYVQPDGLGPTATRPFDPGDVTPI